jgi:hypothetical protein
VGNSMPRRNVCDYISWGERVAGGPQTRKDTFGDPDLKAGRPWRWLDVDGTSAPFLGLAIRKSGGLEDATRASVSTRRDLAARGVTADNLVILDLARGRLRLPTTVFLSVAPDRGQ